MSADRPGSSDDEEFERIVAGLELSVPPEDDAAAPDEHDRPEVFDPRMSDPVEPDEADAAWDDPDDRFVPPDPVPGPPLDTTTRLAWAGMIGSPAVLVVATIVGYALPRSLAGGLVLVAVASIVYLIVRRGNDDPSDGPDHGAVL